MLVSMQEHTEALHALTDEQLDERIAVYRMEMSLATEPRSIYGWEKLLSTALAEKDHRTTSPQ